MALLNFITAMCVLIIPFLANITSGDVRSNLRGTGGDYGGRYGGRKYNFDQFNRVDIDHSHIGGPMTIKAIHLLSVPQRNP